LNLTQLLPLIEEMPVYHQLVDELRGQNGDARVTVLEAAKPYLIAGLYHRRQLPILVITARPENSKRLYEQLLAWCHSSQIRLLPEPDALPYQRITSDTSTEIERIQVLSALANMPEDGNKRVTDTPLVVASVPAFMQKVIAYGNFTAASFTIESGRDIEPFYLMRKLEAIGYQIENTVEVPGTAAHRGGIVDIYPATSDLPARLEFFGNTVESIRLFEPTTQRSVTPIPSIAIGPATELLAPQLTDKLKLEQIINSIDLSNCTPEMRQQFQQELAMLLNRQRPHDIVFYSPLFNKDSVLDYLPQNSLVVIDEPMSIKTAVDDLDAEASQLRTEKVEQGELPHNFPIPHFTWKELEPAIKSQQCLILASWDRVSDKERSYQLSFTPAPSYAGQLAAFIRKLKQRLAQKQLHPLLN